VTLVDSNIPMYLVGAPHPRKTDAQRLVERLTSERQRMVTDAEVLQEILHRYIAIDRRDAIQPAFDAVLGIVEEVFPVDGYVVERAKHRTGVSAALRTPCRASGGDGTPWNRADPQL